MDTIAALQHIIRELRHDRDEQRALYLNEKILRARDRAQLEATIKSLEAGGDCETDCLEECEGSCGV